MPTLMIGIGPASGPPMPPGSKKKPGLSAGGPPIPPRSPKLQQSPQGDDPSGDGKASPEEAIAIRANEHCRNCQNYVPESGECQKVDGQWMPDDACKRYFQAAAQGDDDGDEGGASDLAQSDQDGDEY